MRWRVRWREGAKEKHKEGSIGREAVERKHIGKVGEGGKCREGRRGRRREET